MTLWIALMLGEIGHMRGQVKELNAEGKTLFGDFPPTPTIRRRRSGMFRRPSTPFDAPRRRRFPRLPVRKLSLRQADLTCVNDASTPLRQRLWIAMWGSMFARKNIAEGRFKALVVALARCVALAAAMFLAIEGPFSAEAAHGGTADTHLEMSVAHADGGEAHPDHAICAPFAYCTGALAPAPTAQPFRLSREVGRLKAAAAWRLDGWADDPRPQPPKS